MPANTSALREDYESSEAPEAKPPLPGIEALLLGKPRSSQESPAGIPITASENAMPRLDVRPAYSFRLLQQWEGTVVRLEENGFAASLSDLTDPSSPPEEAVFSSDEVAQGDEALILPGAVFRWSIGYRTSRDGQRETAQRLHFVRLPGWRRVDEAEVEAGGAALARELGINSR